MKMEAIPSESMANSGTESSFSQLLKERKKTIIFVIFVVLIIFLAIFTTREPEAEVTWIRVKAISTSWILFEISLEVDNGNIVGGTLNSLEADIYYNDEYIGHARTTEKYDIKALGKSTLKVDLRIDNLPSSIDVSPEIRAKGTANISVSFLSFDKDFDETVYS
jgi:LEA14-like dessication related protein